MILCVVWIFFSYLYFPRRLDWPRHSALLVTGSVFWIWASQANPAFQWVELGKSQSGTDLVALHEWDHVLLLSICVDSNVHVKRKQFDWQYDVMSLWVPVTCERAGALLWCWTACGVDRDVLSQIVSLSWAVRGPDTSVSVTTHASLIQHRPVTVTLVMK